MLTRTATVALIAALTFLSTAKSAIADVPVGCIKDRCGLSAFDPGTSGGSPTVGKENVAVETAGVQNGGTKTGEVPTHVEVSPTCEEVPLSPQPTAGSPWWSGQNATEGLVVRWVCPAGLWAEDSTPRFRPNADPAAPAAPPPVDPAVLAQQAYQALKIPNPQINFGPNANQVAVNYWVYLWAGDTAPLTASATAGTVTVTATATLSKVVWTMGEPVSATHFTEPAPPITCAGGGINPGPDVDIAAKNPIPGACAYKYRTKSTPERTNDARTWPVTAAASWTITWTANTGESGNIQAPTRVSNTNLYVGEWRTVLIPNTPAIPGQ
ncbi:hypothetical protein EH165_05860 [Nakamurella antarctica]|uniref:ATP/GTP-binding protein n=1 Tax=Nakamurella antarctica TaxID=1902245 RepID=A0A3G8ZKG1_9ACTN|nr:hypothetical protein [Nakamurella antarctica]AZI57743.1 hypothetical protein EH165_05860 [Nakamurella antarctica]